MNQSGHRPVMLDEVLTALAPSLNEKESPLYFDGTFGRGGHLRALLQKYPHLKAVAADRDPEAIGFGRKTFSEEIAGGRLNLIWSNYADIDWSQRSEFFDAILLDLGVSSPQLDESRRGFSFYHDGPLDMRMNPEDPVSAEDLIHGLSEDELNQMFKELGEIRSPYRVVRALVHDRKTKRFSTTRELASLIERVEGWRKKGFHPATQYFMALRLKVNAELESVESALRPLVLRLKPKGRMAVLTFHSLEDRIVKIAFRGLQELGSPVNKKVIVASEGECQENPRARSAKLRIFERGSQLESFTSERATPLR